MKITVLLGGAADERDVSLASGAQIAAALRKAGHQVAAWDTVSGLLSADREGQLRDGGVGRAPMAQGIRDRLAGGEVRELLTHPVAGNADVYFLALHGGAGEDGRIQALLEAEGVTFTGSDRIGCLLGMDKDLTKRLLRDAGLPTPPWVTDPGSVEEVEQQVGIPTVVKAAGADLRFGSFWLTIASSLKRRSARERTLTITWSPNGTSRAVSSPSESWVTAHCPWVRSSPKTSSLTTNASINRGWRRRFFQRICRRPCQMR